ncbi:C40 family peptidase [Clostridium tagluense]|uniref:NlpC/P60 domain-containing protein n=1 Tax=Clostridium tagluense TaxID=360422 RepID=A0A401UQH4_9CLOT|nr:C40 family peptidase [Clostridium tagluense]GCD11761.1 hypothetical protein Ctaglu_33840 [Clostridium tagluense]
MKNNKFVGQDIADEAKKCLGAEYMWGGENMTGFDCSGLVNYVFKQLGKDISRTTTTQVKEGTAVAKKDLQVGDLIFFGLIDSPHHVGIYIGDDTYIHASRTGYVVKISNLNSRSDYATARRSLIAMKNQTEVKNIVYSDVKQLFTETSSITGITRLDCFRIKSRNEKVIHSKNVTIVILDDGTKGTAKCLPEDDYNKTKGIKIAYLRAKIKSLTKELVQLIK